ncbi:TetR/AcrR family transcriptional regulator [Nonomuraea sp. NPDC049152]|uniref:TetR/AcrR family transcriptional regulator n=1 Tax=Nonomuraea sp. NPDC049152 TaxID=3154350 RepID=UPI0033D165D4
MARKSSSAWEWSRTAQTRKVMLQAAREVFGEHGFAEANVADVVTRAGSSVGSLYHHFGGKAELFMALWEDHQVTQEQASASSVAKAKQEGMNDPVELLITGSRAYLAGAWDRRDLVRLFMDGDGPPGFELLRRTRGRQWLRQNAVLLGAGAEPIDRLTVAVLTSVIGEAAREVATCDTEEEARRVIEAAVVLIRRLDPVAGVRPPDVGP